MAVSPYRILNAGVPSITTPGSITPRSLTDRVAELGINVRDFGAIGNGTTDDTDAIQAAINYAAPRGTPVFLPGNASYLITETLTAPANTRELSIFGDGRNSTTILCRVPAASALSFGDTSWLHLLDFCLSGDSEGGHAIRLVDPTYNSGAYLPQHATLERLRITGFTGYDVDHLGVTMEACGIFAVNALENRVWNCNISSGKIGAYFFDCYTPRITETTFATLSVAGIVDQNNEVFSCTECDFVDGNLTDGTFEAIAVGWNNDKTTPKGGVCSLDSRGSQIIGSKFKNFWNCIVVQGFESPLIEACWVRGDVHRGIYSRGPSRIVNNTFDPGYLAPAPAIVSTGYDASATSVVLDTGAGASMPTVPFYASWYNHTDYANAVNDPNFEVILVTARTDDTLTVTRAADGTRASTKNTGAKVYKIVPNSTRKDIHFDFFTEFGGYRNSLGLVSGNRFRLNGGGHYGAFIQVDGSSSSNPASGVIENNEFGAPTSQSNPTNYKAGIHIVSTPKNLIIRNNNIIVPGNVTVGKLWWLARGSIAPGCIVENNNHTAVNGGVIGTVLEEPDATWPYRYELDGKFIQGNQFVRGRVQLVAGSYDVAFSSFHSGDIVLLTRAFPGGTIGDLSLTRTTGVGFTIDSSSALDTSYVDYVIFPKDN